MLRCPVCRETRPFHVQQRLLHIEFLDTCPICLSEPSFPIAMEPCGHWFCAEHVNHLEGLVPPSSPPYKAPPPTKASIPVKAPPSAKASIPFKAPAPSSPVGAISSVSHMAAVLPTTESSSALTVEAPAPTKAGIPTKVHGELGFTCKYLDQFHHRMFRCTVSAGV